MVRRKLNPAANSRNSKRSLRSARATRTYGSSTPSDAEIKAKEVADRAARFSRANAERKEKPKTIRGKPVPKKQKSPTATAQKPKTIKPKKTKKKKPTLTQYLGEQTPSNARNTISNLSGRGNTSGRITARDSYTSSGRRKSLDEIQGFLQGMNQIIKNEEATQARMTGNNLDTKIRQQKQEDKIRDKPKEVKTGNSFNLQDRIGDPALRKTTCRLWKTELNETFNTLLDNFQHLYKDYETDKFNEAEGKGKKQKITTDSRRGAHGGDTQAQPKAIGESRSDQQVMQS